MQPQPRVVWSTPNGDDLIAYMARISNPENEDNAATAPMLISYMIKHQHWSPFDMCDMCVEIYAPRDITRQILRHRSFCFQEFSQRYAPVDTLPAVPWREARMQDPKNRQSSTPSNDQALANWWADQQGDLMIQARNAYRAALSRGIAKEVARAVLPEGLTMSRIHMKGSVRSWLHYCEVRTDSSTQKEHRDIANACWGLLVHHFPMTVEAWDAHLNRLT